MVETLSDRALIAISLSVATLGLLLLWFASPQEDEQRFVLSGTVTAVHGRSAEVATVISVVGRNLTKGQSIEKPVFWNGVAFVVTQ